MPGLRDTEDLQVLTLQDFARSVPARLLAANLDVRVLRTNALLLDGEWQALDRRVIAVSATVLTAVADLQAAGLTLNLGGLGAMLTMYQQETDITGASVNMSPDVDLEEDRIDYPLVGLPVPIIAKAFRLNIRELAASRSHGGGLDTSHIDAATRKVAEKQEEMLLTGSPLVVQGYPIYGYTTHPQRNTVTGADWGTATNIYANVLSAIGAAQADGYMGPYKLYLHSDQYIQTLAFVANTTTAIVRMIEQIPMMGPGSVRMAQSLTAGQGVLVTMQSNVVDLAIGQGTMPIEWETRGGMVTRYLVFSCMVPRVKATAAGKSGIVHLSSI